ncbi:MAG: AsmA family protein, partial [Deltaproteobacteria bacterium]|nr:AsmA family protein [Deltaproteobacteria bacterium]
MSGKNLFQSSGTKGLISHGSNIPIADCIGADSGMPTSNNVTSASVSHRIVKWFIWLFCVLICTIILLSLTLLLLPRLVSTTWFKQQLEEQVVQVFNRPVLLEQVHWTWSQGILMKGLQITDDPEFSHKPMIFMERAVLTLDLKQLIRRRLVFDLEMNGLEIQLIRNPNGVTNLEQLLTHIRGPEKSKPTPVSKAPKDIYLALPMDIQGRVKLNHISIQVHDRRQDRVLKVHNGSLLLEIPSLMRKPITLAVSMEEELDGEPLPPLKLMARIENLVDSKEHLLLKGASMDLEGILPGLHFTVQCALGDMRLKGD